MIASLRGKLLSKDANGAVIECGGVGYGASMSLSSLTQLGELGSEVSVVVHTHVSQDALRLFAFLDMEERQAFEILIGTSGVGPRLALAILSALSPPELSDVVTRGDKATLTRIPGIGAKTAERLLVELKHRLPEKLEVSKAAAVPRADALERDLATALESLGFKPQLAEKVAASTIDENAGETDLAALVRVALRASTRV